VSGEAKVERHEVGVDDEEICKVLVDGSYNLVVVRFGESF
jgi:hypothetical protein